MSKSIAIVDLDSWNDGDDDNVPMELLLEPLSPVEEECILTFIDLLKESRITGKTIKMELIK